MRSAEIVREAWRNTRGGVSRPILSMVLLALIVGSAAWIQVVSVVQVNRDADRWRSVGASISIVAFEGRIDGAKCDALSGTPGIAKSGALRAGESVELAVLPSTSFATFEGSPGLAHLLGVVGDDARGAWAASDLADRLGASAFSSKQVSTVKDETLLIGGQYHYPEDGRLPILAYTLVSPVPAQGRFDTCWVEVWPEDKAVEELVTYPAVSDGAASEELKPTVTQLNGSEGRSFSGQDRLDRIPFQLLLSVSFAGSLLLGAGLTWARRLEVANALHAGADKVSLAAQNALEAVIWGVPALALVCAGSLLLAFADNPGSPWPALLSGGAITAAGFSGLLFGASAGSMAVSEKRLFRYFKTR